MMSVNLDSVFIVSKAVGKVMIKQGKGSIVNTSSMSGVVVNTPQSQAAYNVSKAGVIMLTKSLAFEWAKHNIRVNTIAPGYMETEMVGQFRVQHQDKIDLWNSLTPMKRMGKPHELGASGRLCPLPTCFLFIHDRRRLPDGASRKIYRYCSSRRRLPIA